MDWLQMGVTLIGERMGIFGLILLLIGLFSISRDYNVIGIIISIVGLGMIVAKHFYFPIQLFRPGRKAGQKKNKIAE